MNKPTFYGLLFGVLFLGGFGFIDSYAQIFTTISISDATAIENSGQISLIVSLNQAHTSTVTADFYTVSSIAVESIDFTKTSGQVIFLPGETSKTITISLIDDSFVEPTETFRVHLDNVIPSSVFVGDDIAIASILNDDTLANTSVVGDLDEITVFDPDGIFAVESTIGGYSEYFYCDSYLSTTFVPVNPQILRVIDCDDSTSIWYIDSDGIVSVNSLNDADGDGVPVEKDCDDDDSLKSPFKKEVIDNVDNDCDGLIDEGFDLDWDNDGILYPLDNCLNVTNPGQEDSDDDGLGDLCDGTPYGLVSAVDDVQSIDANPVNINVLFNDSGGSLTVSLANLLSEKGSTLSVNLDNTIHYDPLSSSVLLALDSGSGTSDSFSYSITAPNSNTDTAQVLLSISGVNDPPEVNDDSAITNLNEQVTITVLSNDSDPEGESLSVDSVDTTGTQGDVNIVFGGVARFVPFTNFVGITTFDYTASDNSGNTNFATVTVEVLDLDSDLDGISDSVDNCTIIANTDQSDFDSDGVGDVCDSNNSAFTAISGDWNDSATWEGGIIPSLYDDIEILNGVEVTVTEPVEIYGSLSNHGTINSLQTIVIYDGPFVNSGVIDLTTTGWLTNHTDDFTNSGTINISGVFINRGTLINSGTLTNTSTFINTATGLVENSGGITNNSVNFSNDGVLNNSGTLDNSNIVNNSGTINNECGGVYSGTAPETNPVVELCVVDVEADISVLLDLDPNPVIQGIPVTYTATVTNNGPHNADTTTLQIHLDSPLRQEFVSTDPSCTHLLDGNYIECEILGLAVGDSVQRQVVAIPLEGTTGNIEMLTNVRDQSPTDPNDLNNQVSSFPEILADSDSDGVADVIDTDDDNDGIQDEIDSKPLIASTFFQDGNYPIPTFGSVTNNNGLEYVISDLSDPQGVNIQVPGSFDFSFIKVNACIDSSSIFVFKGSNTNVKCSSITIDVIDGEVSSSFIADNGSTIDILLDTGDSFFFDDKTFEMTPNSGTAEVTIIAEDGTTTEISLIEGNSITVDPKTSIITADPDNTSDVIIIVDGVEETIPPGESVASSPEQAIQNLIDEITSMSLDKGTENSLTSNLDSAIDALTDSNTNNDGAACGKLGSFENKVDAQDGKKLTSEQADSLRELATDIQSALDCI